MDSINVPRLLCFNWLLCGMEVVGIQKSAADMYFSQMYNLILLITNMRPEVAVAEKTELNEN